MDEKQMCTSYTVLAKICKSVLHSNFNERGKNQISIIIILIQIILLQNFMKTGLKQNRILIKLIVPSRTSFRYPYTFCNLAC